MNGSMLSGPGGAAKLSVRNLRDRRRDSSRYFPDVRKGRIEAPQLQVCLCHLLSVLSSRLDCLRHHHDCPAGTLRNADSAAFAVIVVEAKPVPGAELDHGIVGADSVAIIALEAVAAGEAA